MTFQRRNQRRTATLATAVVALALAVAGPAAAQLKAPRGLGGPSLPMPSSPGALPRVASPADPADASTTPVTPNPIAEYERAGRMAALGWLLLLDRRDWGTAWETASQSFRVQVPIAAWMDGIPKLRVPLGTVQDREPVEILYKTSLPGRAEGHYVTTVFASRFTDKPVAREVVSTTLEADGRWRVIGFITE